MNPAKTETLHFVEWGALLTLLTVLGATLGVVYWQNRSIDEASIAPNQAVAHAIVDPYTTINIEGAVGNPGKLKVLKGTSLKEALTQAALLPDADLSKLSLERKVRKGQSVWIPSKEWVFIEVEGLGRVKLPRGTRFCELPRFITLPEGVERSKFKSKRVLKDREKIFLKQDLGQSFGKLLC